MSWAKIAQRVLLWATAKLPQAKAEPRRVYRPITPGRLTDRQAAYADARRAGLAPTPAARAAGYSPASASQIAAANERLPKIKAAIAAKNLAFLDEDGEARRGGENTDEGKRRFLTSCEETNREIPEEGWICSYCEYFPCRTCGHSSDECEKNELYEECEWPEVCKPGNCYDRVTKQHKKFTRFAGA